MFRVFIEGIRVAARYLRRLREEFAEAQQHMVPVLVAAAAVSAVVAAVRG